MPQKQPYQRADDVRFTQNFLYRPAVVAHIVGLAGLMRGGTVLEIGPGKGIITRELAETVGTDGKIVAVELDSKLVNTLTGQFAATPQVNIINGDILHFDLSRLPRNYAVFANVPFNITSALLEVLLNPLNGPAQAHLILQEDAMMGVNEQGDNAETFKSLMVKPLYQLSLVYPFEKSDFTPQPGVETALFAFIRRDVPLIDAAQYDFYKDFLALVSKDRAGEGAWRMLFSKPQLQRLADGAGLVLARGLKSQSFNAILASFDLFAAENLAKHQLVKGAMSTLRDEQQRREQINRAGGHRR